MIVMELEAIAQYAHLPEGFKFHDWGGGNNVVLLPDSTGRQYPGVLVCAIERISDGEFKTIEITSLKRPATRGVILLLLAPFVAAMEKVIADFNRTENVCQMS